MVIVAELFDNFAVQMTDIDENRGVVTGRERPHGH
jgi:hypothetical protein